MKVGLFFGSFNPIHHGHIEIASYFAETTDLDEVWLVVSPQNPFKKAENLLSPQNRIELVNLALKDQSYLKVCDIELDMAVPSYTIATLTKLHEDFPSDEFSIIMGTENLEKIDQWKNYEQILSQFRIFVYPRKKSNGGVFINHPNVQLATSQFIEISSSEIREQIRRNQNDGLLPDLIWETILERKYYL
jgi:nicotinate-nucleotide adenylyltransferase